VTYSEKAGLAALKQHGFDSIDVAFEQPDHQNGPAFALFASRTKT
jgi:hypothetical protein